MKYYGFRFLLFCCVLSLVSSPQKDDCDPTPCLFQDSRYRSSNGTCNGKIFIENLQNRRVNSTLESQGYMLMEKGNLMLSAFVQLEGNCQKPYTVAWDWEAVHVFNGKATSINLQAFTPTDKSYIMLDKTQLLHMEVLLSTSAHISSANGGTEYLALHSQVKIATVYPHRMPVVEGGNEKVASYNKILKLDASRSYDPLNMTTPGNRTFIWFCKESNPFIFMGNITTSTAVTRVPRAATKFVSQGATITDRTSTSALRTSTTKSIHSDAAPNVTTTNATHIILPSYGWTSTIIPSERIDTYKILSNASSPGKNTTTDTSYAGESSRNITIVSIPGGSTVITPQEASDITAANYPSRSRVNISRLTAAIADMPSIRIPSLVEQLYDDSDNQNEDISTTAAKSGKRPKRGVGWLVRHYRQQMFSPDVLYDVNTLNCSPTATTQNITYNQMDIVDFPILRLNVSNARSTMYMFALMVTEFANIYAHGVNFADAQTYFLQTVWLFLEDIPVISVRCVYNCYNFHVQRDDKLILEAFGISTNIANLNLEWDIAVYAYDLKPVKWELDSINSRNNPRLHLRARTFGYGAPLDIDLKMNSLHTSMPLYRGRFTVLMQNLDTDEKCNIYPQKGWALITDFTVICNVSSIVFIHYIEYHQKLSEERSIILRQSTSLSVSNLRLAAGNYADGYNTTVMVQVFDAQFAKWFFNITNITVHPLQNSGKCNVNYINCLGKIVLQNAKDSAVLTLNEMADSGNHQGAIQIAHVIAEMINSDRNQDENSLYGKMMIKEGMVKFLHKMPLITLSFIHQVITCLTDILSEEKMVTSLITKDVAMEIILKCSRRLVELLKFDAVPYQPKHYMALKLSTLILQSLENVFDVFYRQHEESFMMQKHAFEKKFKNRNVPYNTFRSQLKQELNEKSVDYFNSLDTIFEILKDALFIPEIENGEHISVASQSLFELHFYRNKYENLAGMRFDIQDKRERPLRPDAGYIRFPVYPILNDATVELKVVQFGRNPMAGFLGSLVGGIPPVSIKVINVHTGVQITDFGSPVELYLRPPVPPLWKANIGMLVKNPKWMNDEDVDVHKAFISLGRSNKRLVTFAEPINKKDQLKVITIADHRPHLQDFKQNVSLDLPSYFKPPILPADLHATEMSVYVGVLPSEETAERILEDAKNLTDQPEPVLLYSISLMALQCLHWDEKLLMWSEKKCQAAEQSLEDSDLLHCRCQTLSTFSGLTSTIRMTHQMLFPFNFYLLVPTCYLIVFVVVGLLIIYAILMILGVCCRRRCVASDLLTTVIKDNDPYHRYGYLVSVTTSSEHRSTTNAKVAMRLFGKERISLVHVLSDKSRIILGAGAIDHFLILTKDPLGPLTHLTFTAFSEEEKPSPWYLKSIEIHELSSMTRWYFDFNASSTSVQSITLDDRKIQNHTLKATTVETTEAERSRCSGYALKRRFRSEYVWIDWTSVSSLTLVVLFMLLALFLNLCFRGLPSTNPAEHIGRYGFSLIDKDFGPAIVSALILLAVIVIAVFMRNWFDERRLYVIIDLDELEQRDMEDAKGFVPFGKSDAVTPADSKQIDLDKMPPSETTVYRIKVGRPDEGIYDLSVQPILKPKAASKIEEDQGDAKVEEEATHEVDVVGAPEGESTQGELKSMVLKAGLLALWIILIIILAVLNILYGTRLSHTYSHIWIFCSMLTVLMCALLLHPLAILLQALICPPSAEKKNQIRWLASDLPGVLALRDQRIITLGGPNEYRTYLTELRRRIQYNVIPAKKGEPIVTDK